MSELTYKKITDVEQVVALNDSSTVFINDNGAIKQVAANELMFVDVIINNDVSDGTISTSKNEDVLWTILQKGDLNSVQITQKILADDANAVVHTMNNWELAELVFSSSYTILKMVYRLGFGGNAPDLFADVLNHTITADPNWVAPEANITESAANTLVETKIAELATTVDTKLAKLDKEIFDTFYVDTLSWDGSTTDKTTYTNSYVLASGGMVLGNVTTTYVKVSDFIPDVDTFKLNPYSNMQYETGKDPVLKEYDAGKLVVEREGYYTIAGENIMIVHSSDAEFKDDVQGTVILEPGIYYSIVITTMTLGATTVTEVRSSELRVHTEIFPVKVVKDKQIFEQSINQLFEQKINLPQENGTPNHGTAGQFAVSDGMGGIMWKTIVEAEEVSY